MRLVAHVVMAPDVTEDTIATFQFVQELVPGRSEPACSARVLASNALRAVQGAHTDLPSTVVECYRLAQSLAKEVGAWTPAVKEYLAFAVSQIEYLKHQLPVEETRDALEQLVGGQP
jgi:hypothetical protein